jgi:protein TonB
VKPQVKFTPPVIKEAEKVQEDEKPPPKEKLEKATASTVTVDGDENAKIDAPVIDKQQAVVEAPKVAAPKVEIFEFVEQMPEFNGGEDALRAYLSKNINYPKQANEQGIAGRVVLNFVVNEDGDITDIKVVRGIGYGCDQEAMRVVNSMPKWKPGKQNGKAVKVSFSLPIMFKLEE